MLYKDRATDRGGNMARLTLSAIQGLWEGVLKDLWEKLTGSDGERWFSALKKFLRGENPWEAAREKLLELIGTVMVSVTEKFVARDHFVIDTSNDALVRIGFIDDNFKQWFLSKIEKPTGKTELKSQRLCKYLLDAPILKELGNFAETTLGEIRELLKLQAQGQEGDLLTNGRANIFYVCDVDGVLRAVNVDWNVHYGYWRVHACSVGCPSWWVASGRVFSCNS